MYSDVEDVAGLLWIGLVLMVALGCRYSQIWIFFLLMPMLSLYLYSSTGGWEIVTEGCLKDSTGMALLMLSFWILALCGLVDFDKPKEGFLLMAFLLSVAFTTTNLLVFYIVFELTMVVTLYYVAGKGGTPERAEAGVYMGAYMVVFSVPFLCLLVYSFYTWGHVTVLIPYPEVKDLAHFYLLFLSAFMAKLPIFPFHAWLPKAHVEASLAGSMILAALLLKLGGLGLMRVLSVYSFGGSWMVDAVVAMSVVGGVNACLACLRQTDMKALIAYSSVAHMSTVFVGIMSNSSVGWAGASMMMVAHGLTSSLLFVLVTVLSERIGSRNILLCKGLALTMPAFTFWWFMALACNMGAPSLNLLAEVHLYAAALGYSSVLAVELVVMGVLGCAYNMYLFSSTVYGGHGSDFTRFMSPMGVRMHAICFFHLAPLFLLAFCSEVLFM